MIILEFLAVSSSKDDFVHMQGHFPLLIKRVNPKLSSSHRNFFQYLTWDKLCLKTSHNVRVLPPPRVFDHSDLPNGDRRGRTVRCMQSNVNTGLSEDIEL